MSYLKKLGGGRQVEQFTISYCCLVEVGVGIELDRSVVLPLDRLQLLAFLLKEEFYHFGMRSDADARSSIHP